MALEHVWGAIPNNGPASLICKCCAPLIVVCASGQLFNLLPCFPPFSHPSPFSMEIYPEFHQISGWDCQGLGTFSVCLSLCTFFAFSDTPLTGINFQGQTQMVFSFPKHVTLPWLKQPPETGFQCTPVIHLNDSATRVSSSVASEPMPFCLRIRSHAHTGVHQSPQKQWHGC